MQCPLVHFWIRNHCAHGVAVAEVGVTTKKGGSFTLSGEEDGIGAGGLAEGVELEVLFDALDSLTVSFWPTKTAIKTATAATTITTKTSAPAQWSLAWLQLFVANFCPPIKEIRAHADHCCHLCRRQ